MDLATATNYAEHIVKWIAPNCERIEIAGSIRRQRPVVNDIDIVCIPRCTVYVDMFQVETGRQNHLWMFLNNYVNSYPAGTPKPGEEKPRVLVGSEYSAAMKQMIVQLPRCQLDLWFADEATFATRLLMRTGSKEHNIWIAQRAKDRGLHWNPYEGLSGHRDARTEDAIYAVLGLDPINPLKREPEHLRSL